MIPEYDKILNNSNRGIAMNNIKDVVIDDLHRELSELKTRFEAADIMNHALRKVNAKLQGKLNELQTSHEREINVWIESLASAIKLRESETKRADVAESVVKVRDRVIKYLLNHNSKWLCDCCSYATNGTYGDCNDKHCIDGVTKFVEHQLAQEAENGK